MVSIRNQIASPIVNAIGQIVITFLIPTLPPPFSSNIAQYIKANPRTNITSFLYQSFLCFIYRIIDNYITMPVSTQYTIQSGDDLTPERLETLNAQLAKFSPKEILEWAIDNLPNLFQTTAFGLTGKLLCILQMNSQSNRFFISNDLQLYRSHHSRYDQ
jgi:hypothetical protein